MTNSAWFDDGYQGHSPSQDTLRYSSGRFVEGRSISWVMERDLLCQFGDRRTRAILAIIMARRSARTPEFFVPPQIAERFGLSARDLCWAMKDLGGKLLETISSTKGKFRKVRLLPEVEARMMAEKSDGKPSSRRQQHGPTREPVSDGQTNTMDPAVLRTLEEIALQQSAGGGDTEGV